MNLICRSTPKTIFLLSVPVQGGENEKVGDLLSLLEATTMIVANSVKVTHREKDRNTLKLGKVNPSKSCHLLEFETACTHHHDPLEQGNHPSARGPLPIECLQDIEHKTIGSNHDYCP
ncbi:unnamed protein product [Sphenostylis stenocarpa]|uniref:Uncharacterized protein n=1 Tax=Sphenostylis stenocarpa TaxID=92480 RepID=A0AA86VR43_9FABA|nr:unnamed protein product [Sphenostylis stenocarpa]